MKKVFLCLEESVLGYLVEGDDGYIFHADKEGITNANKINSLKMKFFTLNRNGMKKYSEIPNHYSQFLEGVEREDIIKKAGLEEDDSLFIKLYKVAGLKNSPINFTISQG